MSPSRSGSRWAPFNANKAFVARNAQGWPAIASSRVWESHNGGLPTAPRPPNRPSTRSSARCLWAQVETQDGSRSRQTRNHPCRHSSDRTVRGRSAPEMRKSVVALKKRRRVEGPSPLSTLRMLATMLQQVQEMLFIEGWRRPEIPDELSGVQPAHPQRFRAGGDGDVRDRRSVRRANFLGAWRRRGNRLHEDGWRHGHGRS